ncbi:MULTISPECIES: hypothetical protein [Clostridium]|uniref:Uncharacterized protein n=2 Tax=Clostridium TaxID=1485 RepID=M1MQG6_9CLOT|nr:MULTISPECIES: hypothetical protein [Clostridium]AGF53867.1 hypothetical protein Cspa_c00320 [Clostridium saccharoperbutylacetonicum N1-4(HMT)]MBC2478562.1 hypothetical protein [Clostridium beijerinckii]NRT59620.1 hypothetical protein [Clostridium saccharoperbutylacetonicum]NSB28812.1 hypothetical protein [Clostridium saccharoperbutylacetonicum]NSB42303.1 hypothetical protein [Clostridium saccharoperbutylacetonicum]
MIIKESIEIYIENTSIEDFKKEIELIESAGYEVSEENDDYVKLCQGGIVVDPDLFNHTLPIIKKVT